MKYATHKPLPEERKPALTRRNVVMDAMIDAFAAQMKQEARLYGIKDFDLTDIDVFEFVEQIKNSKNPVRAALSACFWWNRES